MNICHIINSQDLCVSGMTFGYIQTTSFVVAFPEHKDSAA